MPGRHDSMQEDDLFSDYTGSDTPLPGRLRPLVWEDFVGQEKLISYLRKRPLHSLILYGPPGCGKTTLARLLVRESGIGSFFLSAVSAGVKEVRAVIERGKNNPGGRGMALIIDEIHRFSKTQQDALLQAVEAGWVTLIGATTENPSFEVIGPLLSRCRVYRLQPLGSEQLGTILERALAIDPALQHCRLEERARELLLETSAGDARRLLGILEVALETGAGSNSDFVLTAENLSQVTQNFLRNYDKSGENHYDFISAFIKSLRGSDPDAALLYLAAMLEAGEDPLFIARRLIIFASEDVGNAAPQALQTAVAAFMAVERIGLPEGSIVLAQATTFLAGCPKSNASCLALNRAQESLKGQQITIPNHLRNAPTATHRNEGAGRGYLYPHDFAGHFVDQEYLPPGFEEMQFYHPGFQGQESRITERLRYLRPSREYPEKTE